MNVKEAIEEENANLLRELDVNLFRKVYNIFVPPQSSYVGGNLGKSLQEDNFELLNRTRTWYQNKASVLEEIIFKK